MTRARISKLVMIGAAGAMLLASPLVARAAAQERPAPVVEFGVAWIGFPDDGLVSESAGAGAVRFYASPRLSLGPEITFIQGEHHSHLVATGNVTFDVLGPSNGQAPRVTPFLVAGGGVFQTREQFVSGRFTSSEGAFTVGGGVRGLVTRRVIVGVDARIGWELHIRVSGMVGVRLGP